jgi:hypothetical protein
VLAANIDDGIVPVKIARGARRFLPLQAER